MLVIKKDSENGDPQGNASLAGAVYGLYRDGELIDTYSTDEKGYFKTREYVCGNHTIQEISPSEGYMLDPTVYSVGAEAENYIIENNSIELTVFEDIIIAAAARKSTAGWQTTKRKRPAIKPATFKKMVYKNLT